MLNMIRLMWQPFSTKRNNYGTQINQDEETI